MIISPDPFIRNNGVAISTGHVNIGHGVIQNIPISFLFYIFRATDLFQNDSLILLLYFVISGA